MFNLKLVRSKAPSPLARKLHEKNLVMGTIAKTMLGEGLIMNEFLTSMQGKKNDDLSMKPRRIFLNNSGLMDKIAPILQEMGMPKKSIVSILILICREHEHISNVSQ